jgi:hypothetical protein
MATSVEELCDSLAAAFSKGRTERLSQYYVYPLVVYLPDGIRIEMTPEQTAETVFARRAVALRAGMRSVQVRIEEVREIEGGRFVTRLSWEYLGAGERRIARSAMRYFGRRFADGTLRIELIEFTELAFAGTGGGLAPTTRQH